MFKFFIDTFMRKQRFSCKFMFMIKSDVRVGLNLTIYKIQNLQIIQDFVYLNILKCMKTHKNTYQNGCILE